MNAADSINARTLPPRERDLGRRLAIVAAFVFVFTAAFAHLPKTYSSKFHDVSGEAKWIWAQHRMSDDVPIAFFAARDFELPENRIFTHIKVAADPEYTLYLNGRDIAGRQTGENVTFDLYDVSGLVKTGRNRMVIAVRAPRGVGGLLATVDIASETPNWVVTNDEWKIYRTWSPEILLRDRPPRYVETPLVVGEPPIGRWNYPEVRRAELRVPPATVMQPLRQFETTGLLPTIELRGGVAVAGTERAAATVFEFPPATTGRVRLTVDPNQATSQAVNIRFANEASELEQPHWGLRRLVLAPGESVIETPEAHSFRYVMVFGWKDAKAEVLR